MKVGDLYRRTSLYSGYNGDVLIILSIVNSATVVGKYIESFGNVHYSSDMFYRLGQFKYLGQASSFELLLLGIK